MSTILPTLLAGLPVLAGQLLTTLALLGIGVLAYFTLTPFDERRLVREGNVAAGIVMCGTLISLAIPLAATLASSGSEIDILIWGFVALVIQLLAFLAASGLDPRAARHDRGRERRGCAGAGGHPDRGGAAQRRGDGGLIQQGRSFMYTFIQRTWSA